MKTRDRIHKIMEHCKETKKNKIWALILIGAGILSVIPDGDGTMLVVFGLGGIALFFAKENMMD